jgi:multimeric flavodoxin WrbA
MSNSKCAVEEDELNFSLRKMIHPDEIILLSPVFFVDLSAAMKAIIESPEYVDRLNVELLKRKVGTAVVAERPQGSIHTFETLNNFSLTN